MKKLIILTIAFMIVVSCKKENLPYHNEEFKHVLSENKNNSSNNNIKSNGGKRYLEKSCTFTDANGVRRAGILCTSESSGFCKKQKDCTAIDNAILEFYFPEFNIDTWDRTKISDNIDFMTYLSEEYPEDFYTP
ncbi:MAG: hypothetical protein KatS3mg035_1970 [Bacteroidia bacterium]|nr:MAG: hypothetical protein KatS3mg035_1970 [Bacteroidia bacterium]